MLVPLDGSELSTWGLEQARPILERPGLFVSLLHVVACEEARANDLGFQSDRRHRGAMDFLAAVRARIGTPAQEVGVDLRFGDPAKEILRDVAENRHDVVLMSTYGSALLGKVARQVLRASPVPLLLLRPRWEPDGTLSPRGTSPLKKILIVLSEASTADEIVPAAERMARTLDAEAHLFRAVSREAERRGAEDVLEAWRIALEGRGIVSSATVRTGDAAASVLSLIREGGFDAVALATRARSWLSRMIRGSTMRELLRAADVPILTQCVQGRRRPLPVSALEHRRVWIE